MPTLTALTDAVAWHRDAADAARASGDVEAERRHLGRMYSAARVIQIHAGIELEALDR